MPQFWCRSCLVLVQSQGLVDLLVMSETHPVCLNRAVHWSPGCCQTFLDLVDKYLLQTFCLLFDHSPPLLRYFALLDQALRKSLQETRDALVCTITVDIVFPSLPFVSWEYCDRQKSWINIGGTWNTNSMNLLSSTNSAELQTAEPF